MRIAIAALLLSCALPCYAPIFGLYPGLEKLESSASHVVVLEIIPPPPPPPLPSNFVYDPTNGTRSGDHEPTDVRIKSSLKGALVAGTTHTMQLRLLHGFPPQERTDIPKEAIARLPTTLEPSSTCLLVFLHRHGHGTKEQNRLWSVNDVGGMLAVQCSADLKRRKGESTIQTVRRILAEWD